jgi:hypothetical protein
LEPIGKKRKTIKRAGGTGFSVRGFRNRRHPAQAEACFTKTHAI